ncbi:LolA family protein [Halopiger djelfimassiliensis]|uniref:LolA family protein n=1 Tax=Halopiger djelfimassiliensis TaxID=1293047 RepID=UPI000677F911|nr:hypothetical protein [Halopiger djelfimassiliensis]
MRRRRILAAGTFAALAGCVAVPGTGTEPTAEDLVRDAIATRRNLTDLSARRITTAETPTETSRHVERIYRRPPAEKRMEVVESDDPDMPPGTVSVRSRSITWDYYPDDGLVSKRYHPNRVVTDGPRLALEDLLEDYDLVSEGTETVDGREAHRITAEPKSDDDPDRSIELLVGETVYRIPLENTPDDDLEGATVTRSIWIDDEYRYPIAERNVVRNADGDILHRMTVTYEELAIDEGLPPGTFTYEPPADAEVVTIGTEPDGIFASRAAAATKAPYELPEPSVPEPYELDRVTVVETGPNVGTTTTLWYVDPQRPERELFVAVRETRRFDPDVLESISLDGRTAYRRDGRIQSVFWECDDLNYEVSSVVDGDSLREIASSIGCP